MSGCHAEQLVFLVYGLRFARFYFRTISLPILSNGNQSLMILNIDNPYFEQMVGQIYPTELQLNKANSSDTEAPFWGLELVNNKWHSFF